MSGPTAYNLGITMAVLKHGCIPLVEAHMRLGSTEPVTKFRYTWRISNKISFNCHVSSSGQLQQNLIAVKFILNEELLRKV